VYDRAVTILHEQLSSNAPTMRPSIGQYVTTLMAIMALLAIYFAVAPESVHLFPIKNPVAHPTPLRILPIGDSITEGYYSTTGNGYRLDLLHLLSSRQAKYIGTQKSGTMENSEHEGYGGAIISEIAERSRTALTMRPNIALLLAGVNDINRQTDVPGAPKRLMALVEQILTACPDAVVLVAQLTPFWYRQEEINVFNDEIELYLKEMIASGRHIVMVKMDSLKDIDMADGLHPNDFGYARMAENWLKGIKTAEKKRWIVPPVEI